MVRHRALPSRAALAAAAVTALVLGIVASTAAGHAQSVGGDRSRTADADGPCAATATLSNGETVDPYASRGVYTAPFEGSASYTGSIDVAEERRFFSGRVWVNTPLGTTITIKSWDGDGDNVGDTGSVTWSIPKFLPAGVIVTVRGQHNDAEADCSGSIVVKLEGKFTSSPIGPASIALTVLSFFGLLFAAVPVGGAR